MSSEYQFSLLPKTIDNAEPRAQSALDNARKQLGFVPNMYAVMANSPGLLESYLHGYTLFRAESGFTPAEQEIVFLTNCVSDHQPRERLPLLHGGPQFRCRCYVQSAARRDRCRS